MRRALPLALLPLLAGCALFSPGGSSDEPRACTAMYAYVTVRVVDEAGRPLDGLTATSTNKRTGEVLRREDASPFGEGVYAVATDGHLHRLDEDGDPFHFRAEGGGRVAEADFVIGSDGCHVVRREGPETVTAR